MSETQACARCGAQSPADAPEGLCPACLLSGALGAEAPTALQDQATQPLPDGSEAPIGEGLPSPAQLDRDFPQLSVLGLLGRGGMGAVYKARQSALDRLVAIKVLPPSLAARPGFAERFLNEARALARLDHPNIVKVFDFGQRGELCYFIMEYIDGVDLRRAMAGGGLEPTEALTIVPQVCAALQYAHDTGIVHRDIKPENILMDRGGQVKIADFGLARLADRGSEARLTGAGHVLGTPHYMAPEQLASTADADHRADIYSLGVVLYELLTGELPLGRFAPPSQRAAVDARLDQVVLRALEKEPEKRYQTARQVGSEVEDIRSGPVKSGAPLLGGLLRRRLLIAAVTAALTLSGLLTWAYLTRDTRSIFEAMAEGDDRAFARLLQRPDEVNSRAGGSGSDTPLMRAAAASKTAWVKALIKAGASIDAKNSKGFSALLFAANRGHLAAVEALLEAGASVNERETEGSTALHLAAWRGDLTVVERLIRAGASLDQRDNEGNTPLIDACRKGHDEVARLLIRKGAETKLSNNEGYNAFHFALRKGDQPLLLELLEKGFDVNERVDGVSPIFYVAQRYDAAVKRMLELGADPSGSGSDGCAAWSAALRKGQLAIARRLVEAGAALPITDKQGETPFMLAAASGSPAIMRYALELARREKAAGRPQLSALRAARDNAGRTALNIAVNRGFDEIIELLESEEDFDQEGGTPIDCAYTLFKGLQLLKREAYAEARALFARGRVRLAEARAAGPTPSEVSFSFEDGRYTFPPSVIVLAVLEAEACRGLGDREAVALAYRQAAVEAKDKQARLYQRIQTRREGSQTITEITIAEIGARGLSEAALKPLEALRVHRSLDVEKRSPRVKSSYSKSGVVSGLFP